MALLAGVESHEIASGLLDQIQYASAVTWNEPSHEATEPSISTMIVGAFLGTGTILMLAVIFTGVNLLVDVAYAFADPRIKW